MPPSRSTATSLLRTLLDLMPIRLLEILELHIQESLGKGSGAWSTKNEVKQIVKVIKREALTLHDLNIFDIGANAGEWTAELSQALPSATIVAFEPSASAFDKLEQRFQDNQNIKCFQLALANRNTKTKLYSDQKGSGLASLTKRRVNHFGLTFSFSEEIEVRTLDTWTSNFGIYPAILKLDVEGHEMEVLLGAQAALKHIKIIQFEFGGSNIDTKSFFQDFWYFFEDLDFAIYRIVRDKIVLITNYSESLETFRTTNYLAIKRKN